ncbi:RraA family protein [Sphingomonas sp. JS21-1]|uniref:RraA family protein n=1 Tax=Sphingomonas palmae TaxID=1855283 RepID=UPI00115FF5E9
MKALGATPRTSVRRGAGDQDGTLRFADATINPGDRIVVDVEASSSCLPENRLLLSPVRR